MAKLRDFSLFFTIVLLLGCGSGGGGSDSSSSSSAPPTSGSPGGGGSGGGGSTGGSSSGGGSNGDGNDTLSTADPLIFTGQAFGTSGLSGGLGGTISSSSDDDWYFFDIARAGALEINTIDTPGLDPVCELIDDEGFQVIEDDDGGVGDNCRIAFDFSSPTGSSDRWYFRIRGFGSSTGEYRIQYDWEPTALSSSPFPVGDPRNCSGAGNDCPQGAAFIDGTTEGSGSGTINPVGDVDWWEFNPTGSGSITVFTTGSTDTVCETYNADFELQAIDDQDGAGNNCRIGPPEDSGDYGVTGDPIYIRVEEFNNDDTGEYQIFWELN